MNLPIMMKRFAIRFLSIISLFCIFSQGESEKLQETPNENEQEENNSFL